jgi:hypothetical protein
MKKELPTIHGGIDVSKDNLAVAIAGDGVRDEVLSLRTFENAPPASIGCPKNFPGVGHPSRYAMKRGPRDMAVIGRCKRLVSNAVLSRPR